MDGKRLIRQLAPPWLPLAPIARSAFVTRCETRQPCEETRPSDPWPRLASYRNSKGHLSKVVRLFEYKKTTVQPTEKNELLKEFLPRKPAKNALRDSIPHKAECHQLNQAIFQLLSDFVCSRQQVTLSPVPTCDRSF